jgi:hypothetical protein
MAAEVTEDVVREFTKAAQDHIRSWYQTPEARSVMDRTNKWQLAWTWEAEYKNGDKFRQYDEVTFIRILKDPDFTPDIDRIISTGTLDKKQTVKFTYHPTALTRRDTPWYPHPYVFVIHPERDERLLAFWEVDYRPRDGFKLYRHAIGVSKVDPLNILTNGNEYEVCRSVLVFSPSGTRTFANTTNVSFEGE